MFGGIAGEEMAAFLARTPGWRAPDMDVVDAEAARAELPLARPSGDLNGLRERLLALMWDEVGVIRTGPRMQQALGELDAIEHQLLGIGVGGAERAFNLTWHDWLNLRSLVEISRVITLAACQRENSRGAHFREDFPEPGDFATSRYTVARQRGGRIEVGDEPVVFTRVKPGETLLKEGA